MIMLRANSIEEIFVIDVNGYEYSFIGRISSAVLNTPVSSRFPPTWPRVVVVIDLIESRNSPPKEFTINTAANFYSDSHIEVNHTHV